MAKTHFCYDEGRAFPMEQFEMTKDGSFIHMVSDPHFADTGDPCDPGQVPGPPDAASIDGDPHGGSLGERGIAPSDTSGGRGETDGR